MDFFDTQRLRVSAVTYRNADLDQHFAESSPNYEMVNAYNRCYAKSISPTDYHTSSVRELSEEDGRIFGTIEFIVAVDKCSMTFSLVTKLRRIQILTDGPPGGVLTSASRSLQQTACRRAESCLLVKYAPCPPQSTCAAEHTLLSYVLEVP
jgi:hypothetical protein